MHTPTHAILQKGLGRPQIVAPWKGRGSGSWKQLPQEPGGDCALEDSIFYTSWSSGEKDPRSNKF